MALKISHQTGANWNKRGRRGYYPIEVEVTAEKNTRREIKAQDEIKL